MAYLFQSGSLDVQLSGGAEFNYSDISTHKNITISADNTGGLTGEGKLTFGASANDCAVYWDGAELIFDNSGTAPFSWFHAGTQVMSLSASGLALPDPDGAFFCAGSKVLDEVTLGATVTGSALTTVGTLLSPNAIALTCSVSLKVDGTISGSSTLIIDGNTTLNSQVEIKGNIITATDSTYDIGSTGVRYSTGFFDNVSASADVAMTGLGTATLTSASAGFVMFESSGNGVLKKYGLENLVKDLAGSGLSESSGKLTLTSQAVADFGDEAVSALSGGMNYARVALTANRVWTLPQANTFSNGDVVRVKVAALAGNTLSISPNSNDLIDDLAADVDIDIESDNASVTLMCVDNGSSGIWKII